MADGTKIEWADATLNYVNGCSRVSPGCGGPGLHGGCYAELLAGTRLRNHPTRIGLTKQTPNGPRWTGAVRMHEPALLQALSWKRGRKIFWNAHGDLFHENVPDEAIDRLFAVCALTPQHTHMILTKRAARMREWFAADQARRDGIRAAYDAMGYSEVWLPAWPLPNVWLGVSVEDQERADERIPDLLATPAAVRFISAEPLLGPVDLTALEVNQGWDEMDALNAVNISTEWREWCEASGIPDADGDPEVLAGFVEQYGREPDGKPLHPTLDWVIVGGESGPKARPMHPDWARSLRDQCQAAGVPFLFKQWGAWVELPKALPPQSGSPAMAAWSDGVVCAGREFDDTNLTGKTLYVTTKGAAGRLLDGREWTEFPA